MNWELFGCFVFFVLLIIAALFAGHWFDSQCETEEWWGCDE